MKDGARDISNLEYYGKLSFTWDAKCYFYGCTSGMPSLEGTKTDSVLQRFANNQRVVSYGNIYVASFSSEEEYRKRITEYDENIYLYSYGTDLFGKPWEDADKFGLLSRGAALGVGVLFRENKIEMAECIPKSER